MALLNGDERPDVHAPTGRSHRPYGLSRRALITTAVCIGASTMQALPADAATNPLCQTVTGIVLDVYRVPIAGANVRVVDSSCGTTNAVTDAQGRYSASVYPTVPASGTASKSGYASASHSVAFSLVGATVNDFILQFAVTASIAPSYVRPGQSVTVNVQTTAPPLRAGGSYLCAWGGNQTGQLGSGDFRGSSPPIPAPPSSTSPPAPRAA